ncbi:MAG: hypothetical protein KDE14_11260 [Rhodobacteraceae bacterium]|nr:hypothetical protein [Paracoccaceae bacterium]
MLGELWRYWTTFAPERVRKFGYLKRLIALEFRAKRCAAAWQDHLSSCQRMILKAADLCKKRDVCVVVGSGLLLEVPLEGLADRFKKIYLVDMFHMPAARRQARKHANVTTLTGDVTGVFAMMKEGYYPSQHVPAPPARIPHLKDADLVVSCNCLTQLAGPFVAYFEATRNFSELDSDKFAYQVMEHHVHAIVSEAPDIALIITDFERYELTTDGVANKVDLLKAYRLPAPPNHLYSEEWDWLIAPRGEEHQTRDIEHVVDAKVYQRDAVAEAEEETKESEPEDDLPIAPDLGDKLADH